MAKKVTDEQVQDSYKILEKNKAFVFKKAYDFFSTNKLLRGEFETSKEFAQDIVAYCCLQISNGNIYDKEKGAVTTWLGIMVKSCYIAKNKYLSTNKRKKTIVNGKSKDEFNDNDNNYDPSDENSLDAYRDNELDGITFNNLYHRYLAVRDKVGFHPDEKLVMSMLIERGMTQQEVAVELNVPFHKINNTKDDAFRRIRRYLKINGLYTGDD